MPWACGEKYYYSLDTDKNKKQADDPGTLVTSPIYGICSYMAHQTWILQD